MGRLALRISYRGAVLTVEVKQQRVAYKLVAGEPVELVHTAKCSASARTNQ